MGHLDEVAAVLADHPGRTSAEVRDVLRARGRVSMTTADVARALGSRPSRFRSDGAVPPRWWLAAQAPAAAPLALPSRPSLYRWQTDALTAWRARDRRGVVEAVTGAGKTMLGLAATVDARSSGSQVCILVPTRELLQQWRVALGRHLDPTASIGLLGADHRDRFGDHDVLIAVVNSARGADLRPRRPGSLLIADECHRYGSDENRLALEPGFPRRLGLSATYARADDGNRAWLDPYFGGTCYQLGYRRAIDEGVVAHFSVALIAVCFDPDERTEYDALTLEMSKARAQLHASGLVPDESIGAFFAAIARLAKHGDNEAVGAARQYLRSMQQRRHLLAETPGKADTLAVLAPALRAADRAIVFTQSIIAAERAAAMLRTCGLRAEATHSALAPSARQSVLTRFGAGSVEAICAPQVLDEGVDVPAADVAVILASSRTRRQMVQRLGRILRPKADGRVARLVIVYVEGTIEDPALGAHEGFLDEVDHVADLVRRFPPGTTLDAIAFVSAHA